MSEELIPEYREQYRNYARAIGRADAETMSDDQLRRLMDGIAEDCAKYGCD